MVEALAELRDAQLCKWELARINYDALKDCRRRSFALGEFYGALQFNPHRRISTAAPIDPKSIKERSCFLCQRNRPEEQDSEEIIPGWSMLVNPYPILPLHFTIASTHHQRQGSIPFEMASMAERLPGMVVFFNGAKGGASAPDHLHCQAVMKTELPLVNYLESGGDPGKLPFKIGFGLITPDMEGMIKMNSLLAIKGKDLRGRLDEELVNAYFWIGDDGLLRICVIPRKAHRPDFYTSDPCAEGRMVSPGAIDMAGILVLPREQDFNEMTQKEIESTYSQTAWRNGE